MPRQYGCGVQVAGPTKTRQQTGHTPDACVRRYVRSGMNRLLCDSVRQKSQKIGVS
jgi:hypothetical protein